MKKIYSLLALGLLAPSAHAMSRLKDIVSVKGVRDNQIMGYGLVVGLKGTGDSKKEYTGKSMTQMLRQMGVDVQTDQTESKNVASVVVTATLKPFARVGTRLDVTVSSIGDAKSLSGGTLLMTPLRGGDKAVYAVAQGPVMVGGFDSGSKSFPTAGLMPSGALIEKEVDVDFSNRNAIRFSLNNPDFTTAARVAKTINAELGGIYARARDSATIDVMVPYDFDGGVVDMMANLERLPIESDAKASVVINERTGTVVVGDAVRISTVAISHGNLSLEIKNKETPAPQLRGPAADGNGAAVEAKKDGVKESPLQIGEAGDKVMNVPEGATLGEVVRGLNALGVKPRDLISILQALKAQGALQAEITVL